MTQSVKDEAKFLDTRLDDETAAVLEKWNLVILGAALLHDADHIRQAIRWRYKIPMQLWIINLAVYVLPTVAEFLLKNKRTSSFLTVAANGIVTSAAFLKVHLFKPTTDIWGAWNYNYFKLARGVWHEGQFIKGIDWIDWALLLDLPAVAIPACMTAIKKRREFKQNLLEAGIDALTAAVDSTLTAWNVNAAVHSLVIDGIFTGVGSVLSFLPIIVTLFFFLSLLEDTGYMARVAFVMDKLLRRIGVTEAVVTTGHLADTLITYLESLGSGIRFHFVHNPKYRETNYIYSMYLARNLLRGQDVISLHGDLVLHPAVMDALAASGRSVMAVDSTLPLPDKDFKALIQDGRIRRVGVDCFDAGSVECQAAYHWQAADFSSWMDEIERFVERGDVKCYAENAFNAVSGEIPLYPLECGGRLCAEIDNQADREVVLTRFRQEVL